MQFAMTVSTFFSSSERVLNGYVERKLFLNVFHLGRFRREKRDGSQRDEMKTPRGKKGRTPGEIETETPGEKDTHG